MHKIYRRHSGYRWFKHPMECNSQAVTNPYLSSFKNQPHSNSYLLHAVNFAKHVLMKYLKHPNFLLICSNVLVGLVTTGIWWSREERKNMEFSFQTKRGNVEISFLKDKKQQTLHCRLFLWEKKYSILLVCFCQIIKQAIHNQSLVAFQIY